MFVRRQVEQMVCAGARRFFGTRQSSFTAYIFRLRGYVGRRSLAFANGEEKGEELAGGLVCLW